MTRDRAAADYIIDRWGDRTTLAHALLTGPDTIVDDVMPVDRDEVLRDATLLCGDVDSWVVREDDGSWDDDSSHDLLDGALRDAVEYGDLRRALGIRWSIPLRGPDGDPLAGIIWRMGDVLLMVDDRGLMTTTELTA